MRIKSLCLIGFCTLSLIACSKEKPAPQDTQANQATSEATINHQTTVEEKEFDPEKLPKTDLASTVFPYIELPEIYTTNGHHLLENEKFYFAVQNAVKPFEGKLYTAPITTKDHLSSFSNNVMTQAFQQQMEKLGAQKLNDQEIPYAVYESIPDAIEKSEVNIGHPTLTYGFKNKDGVPVIAQLSLNAPQIVVMELKTNTNTTAPINLSSTQEATTSQALEKSIADTGKATVYINFAVNESQIESSSSATIDEIVKLLNANPSLKLAIQGHTDNTGDAKRNLQLSEKRAQSVRAALIENNVSANRLEYKGFGQDVPIVSNSTDEGKAQNRRVELIKVE